jgi:hypothetical protein
MGIHTFSQCFGLYNLTDAPGPHSILGRKRELIPSSALQILQTVRTLTGADGEAPPLLAVVLRVLQDVTFRTQDTSK